MGDNAVEAYKQAMMSSCDNSDSWVLECSKQAIITHHCPGVFFAGKYNIISN